MKGIKAYNLAMEVKRNMYESPPVLLSEKDKRDAYRKYFKLIKASAYAGYYLGQYEYGQQFENMNYLEFNNPFYDPKKCVYWYSKACENGHAEACNNLANFYEKGEGCERNFTIALSLYEKSAKLGSANGKKNHKEMIKDLSTGGKYHK